MTIDEIKKIFGEFRYIDLENGLIQIETSWIRENIVYLSNVPILQKIRCHKKILKQLSHCLGEIEKDGLGNLIDTNDWLKKGGCFVARHILWDKNKPLSTHCWGIALDINPSTNIYGGKASENQERIASYFEKWGFEWGGRWKIKDPMHFQIYELK